MKSTLYSEASKAIESIDKNLVDDVYALSFWVHFDRFLPVIYISYNTNEQVRKMEHSASSLVEAKWNYAFWLQEYLCDFGEETYGTSESNKRYRLNSRKKLKVTSLRMRSRIMKLALRSLK